MTRQRLAEIRQRERGATPRPWGLTRYSGGVSFNGPPKLYLPKLGPCKEYGEPVPLRIEWPPNAEFVKAARDDIPDLLDYIEELEVELGITKP